MAFGLAGCVSLLPKQKPVQLYVFGRAAAPAAAAPSPAVIGRGGSALGVALGQVDFPRAALGDGVLTIRGEEAAYIDGARWLAPAVLLFQEAVERTFDARASVRLVDRGQVGAASATLRLDVREFDARYDPAGAGPPTVVVEVRATLTRADGRDLMQQSFIATQPATEDRVSGIVAAYDAAVQAVLSQVVDWTDAAAPGLVVLPDKAEPAPTARGLRR